MNPVSKDVSDKLVDDGIGTFAGTSGWSINISSEPTEESAPDTCITIYDTGGPRPFTVQNRVIQPVRMDTVQIRVRSNNYLTGWDKMEEIVDAVIGWGRFTVDVDSSDESSELPTLYYGIFQTSDVLWLEKDEKGRNIFVVNFQAKRKEVA